MSGAELIGPAIGAASKAASSGGGKGGGGGGSSGPSTEQAALAQYHYGENLLLDRSNFANTNTGASTMATQASEGARNQFGKEMAKAADKNAALQASANQSLQQLAQQQQGSSDFASGAGAAQSGFGAQPQTTG